MFLKTLYLNLNIKTAEKASLINKSNVLKVKTLTTFTMDAIVSSFSAETN